MKIFQWFPLVLEQSQNFLIFFITLKSPKPPSLTTSLQFLRPDMSFLTTGALFMVFRYLAQSSPIPKPLSSGSGISLKVTPLEKSTELTGIEVGQRPFIKYPFGTF